MNFIAVEFAGPTRLVTVTYGRGVVRHLRVWDVPTGRLLHNFDINDFLQRSQLAISPGGRCLAAYGRGDTVWFFDLQQGKVAAQLPVAAQLTQSPGTCHGITFSPDGRQLAVVVGSTSTLVAFFDLKTGELADQIALVGRT